MVIKNDRINNAGRRQYSLFADNGKYVGTFIESQSLSRIRDLYLSFGFVTLSAFRLQDEHPEARSIQLHQQLLNKIRSRGLGYWEVSVCRQDSEDQILNSDGYHPPGSKGKIVSELHIFVAFNPRSHKDFDEFAADLHELVCNDDPGSYNQDAVMLVYPEGTDDTICLWSKTGGKEPIDMAVNLDIAGTFFTMLRKGSHAGQEFAIESMAYRWSTNFFENMRLHCERQTSPDFRKGMLR
ncbi:MAG TPA: hypothetical protein PK297_11795 [Spirochaetota bacterium]|nr:hypothetical protein [Spirochaetota bacterium]